MEMIDEIRLRLYARKRGRGCNPCFSHKGDERREQRQPSIPWYTFLEQCVKARSLFDDLRPQTNESELLSPRHAIPRSWFETHLRQRPAAEH